MNDPVRRQQALEQEAHKRQKKFSSVFPRSYYMKFIHNSLRFSGVHSAVILDTNCSSE